MPNSPDATYKVISVITAILVFLLICLVGVLSPILREAGTLPGGSKSAYSFHKFQLWLWTMVICPLFALYWGYSTDQIAMINQTGLILLGISGGTAVTAEIISAAQKASKKAPSLKITLPTKGFWEDILMDDSGNFSISRLQQLVFTLVYVIIYVSTFFKKPPFVYPQFDTNAYVLMGISTGAFLLGKGLNK